MANLSGQTIADSTTLARYVYTYNKTLWDQINLEDNTYNQFGEDPDGKPMGNRYLVKIQYAHNFRSFASRPQDAATMPTPGAGKFAEQSIDIKRHFFNFAIDLESNERSKGGGAIGADELKMAFKEGAEVGAWNLNRMVFGDGSGKIAELYSARASASQYVKKLPGVTWVKENMYLDSYMGDGNVNLDSVLVSSTSEGADYDTITLSATATSLLTGGSEFFYLESSYAAAGNEMLGLKAFSSDSSTLHNLAVATYPSWKGVRSHNDAVNRAFNVMHLKAHLSKMRKKMPAGYKVNLMISNTGQMDNYYELVAVQQQFDGAKMSADYGLTRLTFMNIEWLVDPYCENSRIYTLDKSVVKKIVLRPLSLDDRDGQTIRLSSTGDNAWGRLTGYIEMCVKIRCCVGSYEDLAEPESV